MKTMALLRKTRLRGRSGRLAFLFTAAVYNLVRLRTVPRGDVDTAPMS